MVQRDHRDHLAGAQALQHLDIPVQGGLVPAVRRGLDAAPGDGHAVRVLEGRLRPVEILLPAPAPPVAGDLSRPAVNDPALFLFPGGPGVVRVAPLDLMGGCGGSPENPSERLDIPDGISVNAPCGVV